MLPPPKLAVNNFTWICVWVSGGVDMMQVFIEWVTDLANDPKPPLVHSVYVVLEEICCRDISS